MAAAENPSGATMVDAQFTNARVLQPFEGFETAYQGLSTTIPIAFPGIRDPRAADAQPGFDPNLMRGYVVPEGARVILWFPMCFTRSLDPQNPFPILKSYSYRLVWRYKNLADFRNPPARQPRAPYHFPRQSPGAPDSTIIATGVPRLTIPASWHIIAYEELEPVTGSGSLNLRIERITPTLDSLTDFVQPIYSDGAKAVLEQGVLDPATAGGGGLMPIFVPFWTDAEGDELIVLVKPTNAEANPLQTWDFADPLKDKAFSNIYGTNNGQHPRFRDVGIYLQTGTNP